MHRKRLLAYITGSVDQELLLRNDYLATENRILRNQIKGRLHLTDGERITLAEIRAYAGRGMSRGWLVILQFDILFGSQYSWKDHLHSCLS